MHVFWDVLSFFLPDSHGPWSFQHALFSFLTLCSQPLVPVSSSLWKIYIHTYGYMLCTFPLATITQSRTIKCMAHFSAAIQILIANPPSPRNLFAQCLFNNSKACCSIEATLRRVTDSVRPSAAAREPACSSGRGFASSRCTMVEQQRREIELSRLVSALGRDIKS